MRGRKDYLKKGDWNAICDSCGFKFKSSELRKRWDGFMVDAACWEPRHPQDFIKAVKETSNILPWTRPDRMDISVSPFALYIDAGYFDDGESVNDWYIANI